MLLSQFTDSRNMGTTTRHRCRAISGKINLILWSFEEDLQYSAGIFIFLLSLFFVEK